eukprot:811746-Prorocentrum_minimum.AAC.1
MRLPDIGGMGLSDGGSSGGGGGGGGGEAPRKSAPPEPPSGFPREVCDTYVSSTNHVRDSSRILPSRATEQCARHLAGGERKSVDEKLAVEKTVAIVEANG